MTSYVDMLKAAEWKEGEVVKVFGRACLVKSGETTHFLPPGPVTEFKRGMLRLGAWKGFQVGDRIKFLTKKDLSIPATMELYLAGDPRRKETDIVKIDVFEDFWKS